MLWLLHRLCLHGAILEHAPSPPPQDIRLDSNQAGIAFMRGLADFAICNDTGAALDATVLEQVATTAPDGCWAQVEATYFLSAGAAKLQHDPARLRQWLAAHAEQIEHAEGDDHTMCKLRSRYHRVHAFAPQFARDWAAMTADMDLAEEWAGRMRRDTDETRAEWATLTAAVYESRTKEALVTGRLDLAEERARRLVAHAPADPRAHLELGQVLIEAGRTAEALDSYRLAARYGPPGTEIALFMAGQCYELLGKSERACDAYLASLELDPLAVSAAERLAALSANQHSDMARWARMRAAALTRRQPERGRSDPVKPYQQYEGMLGR